MSVNGVVLVNKPTGMTSLVLAKKVGKVLGEKKVGHLGTLDPMGCGLLPVMCGKATKLFDIASDKTKTYRAVFKFGIETDTLDSEGKIIRYDKGVEISLQSVEKVIQSFIGEIEQMPPNFSAKKVNGKKAYELAREGVEVKLKPKLINIIDLKVIKQLSDNTFLFEISCSEGTYIRSLCRDIAEKLSTCGTMCAICRTIYGKMQLSLSKTLNEIQKEDIISSDKFLLMPKYVLDKKYFNNLKNGVKIKLNDLPNQNFKLYVGDIFWGVAKSEDGVLKVVKNLYGE